MLKPETPNDKEIRMNHANSMTRRTFNLAGAAAIAAPMILPSRALSGPNDAISLGWIGVGRRGQQLMGDFRGTKGSQIVAISDLYKPRMEQVANGKNWKTYQDYRQLLESKEVDAVVIATPDHWHALNAIHACIAGKDVYVEKPMTLTIREGREMVKAARKHKRIVQCGSQQRSMKECRIGCELARNQRAGKIHTVHAANYPSPWDQPFPAQPVPDGLDWDMWLGQTAPRSYHKDIFTSSALPGRISIMPDSAGGGTGWGAHGIDIIQWGLGMDDSGPTEIWAETNSLKLDIFVHLRYENGAEVVTDGKGPEGGGVFVGDKGSILVDRGKYKADPEEIAKEPISDAEIKLPVSLYHQQNWLDCIRSRELPIADVEIGHRSTSVCHLINIARWTRRKLQWDPKNEKFVGDDDANTYLDRPRREPWGFPEI